jgi:hypothetical protein
MPADSAWGKFIAAVLEAERVIDRRRAERGSITTTEFTEDGNREVVIPRSAEDWRTLDGVLRYGLLHHAEPPILLIDEGERHDRC